MPRFILKLYPLFYERFENVLRKSVGSSELYYILFCWNRFNLDLRTNRVSEAVFKNIKVLFLYLCKFPEPFLLMLIVKRIQCRFESHKLNFPFSVYNRNNVPCSIDRQVLFPWSRTSFVRPISPSHANEELNIHTYLTNKNLRGHIQFMCSVY